VVYTQSWSTAPFAIYSEIPSAELRAKTLALGSIASQLVNVIVTLTSPFIESSNGGTFGGQIGYICKPKHRSAPADAQSDPFRSLRLCSRSS
jgi:hypothetical protein